DLLAGVGGGGDAAIGLVQLARRVLELAPGLVERGAGDAAALEDALVRGPGLLGPLARLAEGGAGGARAVHADPPAGEAEAVAVARHHDGVGVGNGRVEARQPHGAAVAGGVDPHGVPDEGVEEALDVRTTRPRAHV